jgi:hypothetical protein
MTQNDMFQNLGDGLLTPCYPYTAGSKDQDTGKQAAQAISKSGRAGTLRDLVLDTLIGHKHGLTPDECAQFLCEDILSIRPRFSELRLQGAIKDSGIRRLSSNGKAQKVMVVCQQ